MIRARGPAKPHPVIAHAHDQRRSVLKRGRMLRYATPGMGSSGRLEPVSLGILHVASGHSPA